AEAKRIQEAANKSVQRSVYLPLLRTLTPRSLEVFDFAEQGLVVGSRDSTTVATQALYLLNDPFVRQQSQALANKLILQSIDEDGRIQLAYQTALGRPATEKEVARVEGYLKAYEADARKEGVKDGYTAAW